MAGSEKGGSAWADVRWIFFDLGSTLVDESECYRRRYAEIVAGTGLSAEAFERKAVEFARQNRKGDHAAARFYGLPLPGWHKELERLYPGVESVLATLKGRGYRLGVIANQSPGTLRRLEGWGIAQYFEVVMASAEEGLEKPDARLFRRALFAAGCRPEHAAMVGDRLDNDVAPARRLGMKAVWVRQGPGRYAAPRLEAERADAVISDVRELARLPERRSGGRGFG